MTRRELPPLRRDIVFLIVGGAWGTYTVMTAGPWPLMLISAATMLGPGFLRLWLSGPGTASSPGLPPPGPPEPPVSPLPGPSGRVSEAEARP